MVLARQSTPRHEPFGHICRCCSKCCYHKDIQINPYEVARLARKLGQTTTEFRAASTRDGAGTILNQTETGACVFLGSDGCTVHSDRPLVCRLYPLGRHLPSDGAEWFSQMELHLETAGEFTGKGTIGEYLDSQGAAPFLQAADQYFRWICAALEYLGDGTAPDRSKDPAKDSQLSGNLLDMDAAIARHCAATELDEPANIENRKRLHLAILDAQLGSDNRRQT